MELPEFCTEAAETLYEYCLAMPYELVRSATGWSLQLVLGHLPPIVYIVAALVIFIALSCLLTETIIGWTIGFVLWKVGLTRAWGVVEFRAISAEVSRPGLLTPELSQLNQDFHPRYKLGLILTRNCHNLTRIFTPGRNDFGRLLRRTTAMPVVYFWSTM